MEADDVSKTLSDEEVAALAGGGVKTLSYADLKKIGTWDELVTCPAQAAAVLFPIEDEHTGHWLGVWNGPDNTAHIFDPMGTGLDEQRKEIGTRQAEVLGVNRPEFKRLLATTHRKPVVSRVRFQMASPSIQTCGRWVAMRLKHRNMTDAEFNDFVHEQMREDGLTSSDKWVAEETAPQLDGGTASYVTGGGLYAHSMYGPEFDEQ